MYAFVIMAALAVWFFDLWPFYSGHFRPLLREHDYEVLFYYENNTEEKLGLVSGIETCRFKASEHARQKNIKESKWTYRCCLIRRSNQCARVDL